MAKATNSSVIDAWSEKAGRKDQYDLREVENHDGSEKGFQLIDKDTGSLVVQASSLQELQDRAGDALIDDATVPKESSGEESEKQYTSRGQLAFPTQPEALSDPSDTVEIDTSKAVQTPNQKAELTRDQVSSPEVSRDPNVNTDKKGVPADRTAR